MPVQTTFANPGELEAVVSVAWTEQQIREARAASTPPTPRDLERAKNRALIERAIELGVLTDELDIAEFREKLS